MNETYDGGIYWLLDARFDFLLPSFLREFEVEEKDIVFVNSYHWKHRDSFQKVWLPSEIQSGVTLMEPDELNRIFSKSLKPDQKSLVISFSGAGLPAGDYLTTLTSAGPVADMCNDKWWQYHFFLKNHIPTPVTMRYKDLEMAENEIQELVGRYKRIVIKKPDLSGGYKMAVLSSAAQMAEYRQRLQGEDTVHHFLVSEYIPHSQSLSGVGVVRKDGGVLFINMITEQVLYRETAFEGSVYPAFLDGQNMQKIRDMTTDIGKALGQEGYYGAYNVDYILGNGTIYAVEINARLCFGSILAACLYGENFWKVMKGEYDPELPCPQKRLVLGKIKGTEGKRYADLTPYSSLTDWFESGEGCFWTFYCGTDRPQMLRYGSFIGLFGEYFSLEADRETVLDQFWKRCLTYYDDK